MNGSRSALLVLSLFVFSPAYAAEGRPAVLVNPRVSGGGTARTIQEGIDLVASGGKVMVLPGVYNEALVIDKGLTLEPLAGNSGAVIVAPPASSLFGIEVTTREPVVVRGIRVEYSGTYSVGGIGAVDLTVENIEVVGAVGFLGRGVVVLNDASLTLARARLEVRDSFIDLLQQPSSPDGITQFQNFGIGAIGDIDALIVGNRIRRTGGACIFIQPLDTPTGVAGTTNVDVINNDIDQCFPTGRAGSILVGASPGRPTAPVPATGTVNIIGNVIANSAGSCRAGAAINFELFTGRIEHNVIDRVVSPCALPGARNTPAGIWVGSLRSFRGPIGFPPATPVVRFNDIVGNAFAGLVVSPDQTVVIDARCNWWGSVTGPSGDGPGSGDAVRGAAVFAPWALQPAAGSAATCP